jgi:RHS repeat-associated protein
MVKENPNCGRDRSGKPTPRLHVCRIARIGGGLATDSPRPPKIRYQYAIADHQGNTRVLFSSVTPTPSTLTATFEGAGGDNNNLFSNVNPTFVVPYGSANNTPGGAKVVRMNQTYSTGPAKSLKVYPGDKVDMETYCYYESASGYGGTNSAVTTMVTSIASAFGGVSGGAGENGSIFNGINSALGQIGLAPNLGDGRPSAYLNYILFDQQYKVVDMGWTAVPSTASFAKQKISIPQITVKEAGYMFVYLSYETASNNWVYFDDFKVTQTKTNVLQYNEYYAYGLQTANSWTRENTTGNNFLGNGGTELNTITGVYDLEYRNYDPILGRMNQVDPMASQYSSLTPYNYSFNDPVTFNDPDGADPIKKEPLPTDANPDPGTGWGAWHLPGMGGSGSWRIGPGSGNHWSDQYRSAYDNAMLMSSNTFNSFYGINDDNRASFAASLGSYVPSAYYSTFFAAMGGGERKLGDAVINARHYFFHVDGSGNFYLPYTNTVVNPSDYLPSGSPDPRAGIGLSSGFESYAPVWGSGRDAIYWFQQGDVSRGMLYSALAISDVFLVKAIAKGIAQGGIQALAKGNASWGTYRNFYTNSGFATKSQRIHHGLIEQNSLFGKNVPNFIKHQMFNLKPFANQATHMRLAHGQTYYGVPGSNFLGKIYYGTPSWVWPASFSTIGHIGF